jgi:O-antigen ligase
VSWTLFALAGAYWWTLVPTAIGIAIATAALPPRILTRRHRWLDAGLICCVAYGVLQLVPLPIAWRALLSPHAGDFDRAIRFGQAAVPRTAPLSIAPAATLKAVVMATLTVLTFWSARETAGRGVLRMLVRPVAWSGLVVSVVAIFFRAEGAELIYGLAPVAFNAVPYGPYVNPNHLGTWLIMALPLTCGYMVARVRRHANGRSLAANFDAPMVWLLGSAAVMLMAAIISLSRSTAVGLLAGAMIGAACALRRTPRAAGWIAAAAVIVVAIALWLPATMRLVSRFEKPEFTETWARPQIWRETMPIVHDFALTGTGMGGYSTAMLLYQKTDRTLFFNQAHNQYLQFTTDGGVLLLIPLFWAAFAFVLALTRKLAADLTPMFWIRVGAVAAIAGALVQSLWETGLRMPANALLFGVVCAIAIADEHRYQSQRILDELSLLQLRAGQRIRRAGAWRSSAWMRGRW